MYTIALKKFGTVLVSRSAGMEAFNALRPQLDPKTTVSIDFDGVFAITPSWLDEFLTQLAAYNDGNVELLPTKNASVLATLPILGSARKDDVARIVQRALSRMHSKQS